VLDDSDSKSDNNGNNESAHVLINHCLAKQKSSCQWRGRQIESRNTYLVNNNDSKMWTTNV